MTLTEFLLARIAEDEAVATEANRDTGRGVEDTPIFECGSQGQHVGMAPARVLAECEAKRRMVAWCSEREMVFVGMNINHPTSGDFVPGELTAPPQDRYMLLLLALPYADHPDHDTAWRP